MKHRLSILSLALVWLLALTAPMQAFSISKTEVADTAKVEGPQIHVDKALFDFGEIESDKTVTHTYIVTNPGTEPLVIQNIYTDCGCTAAQYRKEPIEPGRSTTIEVTFNPIGRPSGFFTKIIRVKSNATEKPLRLYVQGRIKPQRARN